MHRGSRAGSRIARLAPGLAAALALTGLVPSGRALAQATDVVGQCFFSGQNVMVAEDEVIDCSSLRVLTGNATVERGAHLTGDLEVGGGDAVIRGTIDGDTIVLGGDLTVAPGATVHGDAFTTGDAHVDGIVDGQLRAMGNADIGGSGSVKSVSALGVVGMAQGSQVADVGASGQGGGAPMTVALLVLFCLLSALFAVLMVAIAGTPVARVREAARHSALLAILVGCVAWGAAIVLFLPLTVTVIGVVLLSIAMIGGVMLGWAAFSDGLGGRLWHGSRAVAAGLGGALLALVTMALVGGGSLLGDLGVGAAQGPVQCLGLLLLGLLWTWGLGAALLTLYGNRPWPRHATATPASRAEEQLAEPPPAVALPVAAAVVAADVLHEEGTATEPVADAATDAGELDSADAGPGMLPAAAAGVGLVAAAGAAADESGSEEADVAAEPSAGEAAAAASSEETGTADEPPTPADARDIAAGAVAAAAAASSKASETADEPTTPADARDIAAGAVAAAAAGFSDKGETSDEPPVTAEAGPEPSPGAERDVREVPGVSPIFGYLLSEAGIRTVGDLARAEPGTVREALSVPGVVPVDEDTAAGWIAAAQSLAG